MENSFLQDRSVITSIRLISAVSRLIGRATGTAKERLITVVFRYDDFSDPSPVDVEESLFNAFAKYQFPYTFGVIPFSATPSAPGPASPLTLHLSSRKIELLRTALEAGLINIALHGSSHENIRHQSEPVNTEFQGLDYLTQLEKISKGKHFLEETLGIKVNTFIPPWNTYDHHTVSAVEHLGFDCLSADMHGQVEAKSGLKFLPATVEPYELKLAVEKARLIPDKSPVIVALIHPYDFGESGDFDYGAFVSLLEWISQQKDVQVRSIEQVIRGDDDLSPLRFSAYKASLTRSRVTPSYLYMPLNGVYPSIAAIERMSKLSRVLTSLFFLCVLVISMLATALLDEAVDRLLPLYVDVYRIGLTASLVTLSLYALRDLALGFRGMLLVAATIGALLGVWVFD